MCFKFHIVYNFLIDEQPHKHKVVIAGNHELSFGLCDGYCETETFERLLGYYGAKDIREKVSVFITCNDDLPATTLI